MTFTTMQAALKSGRTLIFGHRGAMASAPMNTLAAFELAADQGADGVELDVQLSRDGQAVVIHDFSVDATTDGDGLVADLSLAQLKTLDAGSWFAPEFAHERIPTLDEVLRAFGKKLLINIEIKSADSGGAIESAVADSVARCGVADRVIVSSFNAGILRRFRALCPDVMTGFLFVPGVADEGRETIHVAQHDALHPWHEAIDRDFMAWAMRHNYFVNTWTVNDPVRAAKLQALGVNAIIADDPAAIKRALQS